MRVLADEAVSLQPTGERSLGDRDRIGGRPRRVVELLHVIEAAGEREGTLTDLRAMRVQVHPHAHLELVDP